MSIRGAILPILCAAVLSGCQRTDQVPAISAALRHELSGAPPASADAGIWREVQRFYEARDFAPAWTLRRGLDEAKPAVALLHSAPGHGLSLDDYDQASLDSAVVSVSTSKDRRAPEELAGLDAQITAALLRFGHDVAVGRVDPSRLDKAWKARRESPDLALTLSESLSDLPLWLKRIQPPHPEYEQLHQALAALNAAAEGGAPNEEQRAHAAQLALNLERWRWMPDDFGDRHLLVNIPSFELRAREAGHTVLAMPVVVGKADGHETPVFSGDMQTVVFSPSWNVPESIALGETAPAVAKDISYLERNGIEVFRREKSGNTPVNPKDIDWNDAAEVRQLGFRQLPGEKNALGTVKFLFPNPFDVYLHDTPADSLFSRPSRAFSHGCVRVSQPDTLAQYVLRGSDKWNEATIKAAMDSGEEQHVKLAQTIPVHIVYFTAWVDDGGSVHYEKDVYGYDSKQTRSSSGRKET